MANPSDTNSTIRAAVIQMRCSERKDENSAKAEQFVRQAANEGANVICLQELFLTPYPCQSEDHARFAWAEPIPGPASEQLSRWARECGVVLIGSLFERRAPGLYHNTAVVFDTDGSQAGAYRKMHIPDDPLYYEKFYFTPGDQGFQSFPTRFGRIGVCVCWDQWFPEAARLTALTGAQLIFYPTAIGWIHEEKEEFGSSQTDAWETMMRSHAIANGVYVAAANRVGCEGELEFWGGSFVCDPYGNLLSKADQESEQVLAADCDLQLIDTARTHWPFLRDRRIDAYQGLTQRFLEQTADQDPSHEKDSR